MQAPRLVTIAIIIDGSKVLLVRRARDPCKGKWSFVGGLSIMNPNYSSDPAEAAKDEVKCDLQCKYTPTFWKYYYKDTTEPTIFFVFTGSIIGKPTSTDKFVSEWRWFTLQEALALDLAFDHHALLEEFVRSSLSHPA